MIMSCVCMYMKQKHFKKIVLVGGTCYSINDERVYKHYQSAQKILIDGNEIVGFRKSGSPNGSPKGYSSKGCSNKKHS